MRVVGAPWKHFNDTGAIRAKAVVIAAGGFVMNPEMVAEYTPKLAEKPFVLGNTYDDGLGIRLGVSAGGVTKNLDQVFITAPRTRRRSCSPASSSTSTASGSSPRTRTTRARRLS